MINKRPFIKICLSICLALIIILLTFCSKQPEIKEKPNQFGLFVDSLIEVRDTIQADETLSDILIPHSVPMKRIIDIENKALNVFPLRNFRAENELYIYAKWDSVETVKYMVYVQDAINYIVFDLRDSINIYKKQKPVRIKDTVACGVITNSLYQTFEERKINIEVALKLADVYAWQIDFFRIQQNDSFKVFYEQVLIDDQPVGIGKIVAASFTHRKENYYTFYFEQDKGDNYFDEIGNSIRKAFLRAPLKFSRITSRYSLRRYHPILHIVRTHLGTDYAAPVGTPVLSVGDGIVIEAGYAGGNGNYIKVRHNAAYTTQYMHLSKFARSTKRGVAIKQGQVIGFVGSTGLSTGPHLDFRFWKNGRQVDHLREKFPTTGPIKKENKNAFEVVKNEWMQKLTAKNK